MHFVVASLVVHNRITVHAAQSGGSRAGDGVIKLPQGHFLQLIIDDGDDD